MRRTLVALGAGVAAMTLGAATAMAANPHFVQASATLNNDGVLTASFKEAGLGDNELVTITLSADATATYVCVNRGGKNPSASNKTDVSGPVSDTDDFPSGKNGQVTGKLSVSPPAANLDCPGGQVLRLAEVSYENVTLTDEDNNVSAPISGTFSSGCLLPNVKGACS